MRPLVVVLSATALIAASSQPSRADPVSVDQVNELSAAPSAAAAASPSMVVGISGQLVPLDVFLSSWGASTPSDVRGASSAAAIGDASSTLARHTISPFATPPGLARAPVHFDLAAAQLQAISGRLLAFVEGNPAPGLAAPGPPQGAVYNNAPTGGAAYVPAASGGGGLGTLAVSQPDPTPEPTTIALVGSGLLLGAMGRRRLRQRQAAGEK